MCETLAAAGIRVVAVARRRERLEALQQALVGQGVPIADFLPIVCDITKARAGSTGPVLSTQRPQLQKTAAAHAASAAPWKCVAASGVIVGCCRCLVAMI